MNMALATHKTRRTNHTPQNKSKSKPKPTLLPLTALRFRFRFPYLPSPSRPSPHLQRAHLHPNHWARVSSYQVRCNITRHSTIRQYPFPSLYQHYWHQVACPSSRQHHIRCKVAATAPRVRLTCSWYLMRQGIVGCRRNMGVGAWV
ncbi:hypothetical protein BDW02DRAFT_354952 [Decorospora gaudefroyi]|uniref:Uncharacterized protein n=1 Tax=Decorospora gaudefroyi TaxID=184978 RepID=A0A6A5KCK0_9PLEO|nr:hypothetical protein BDW02DRAFT_354952 [Decorospora gaudefroyi]